MGQQVERPTEAQLRRPGRGGTPRRPTRSGDNIANGWSVQSLVEVLTAIGAAAGLLYPVGFVVLAVQLRITYRFDFSTAWHAATLVSIETVLSQVVRVVWSNFYLLPLLIVWAYLLFKPRRLIPEPPKPPELPEPPTLPESPTPEEERQFDEQLREREEILDKAREKFGKWREQALGELECWKQYPRVGPIIVKHLSRREQILYAFGAGIFISLFILLEPIVLLVSGQPGAALISLFQQLAGILLTCGMFVGLVYVQDIGRRRGRSVLWRLSLTAVVFYVYLILLAAKDAKLNDPPLPRVELSQSGATVQGRLLSQGDGYWKLIVEPEGQIRYISEDEVDSATISK